jgi:glutamate dehydrogenase/leucine dehydrogenase
MSVQISETKACANKIESNPWCQAMQQLDNAAQHMDIEDYVVERLRHPKRALCVSIPVRMDDGSYRVFDGFRIQHNVDRGPAKGGLRFHPNVTFDEVKALSFWMTMKNTVVNLPYGGGKGGVICNPKEMSIGEIERLSRRFFSEISIIVGPEKDIPAPDVNTTPQIMAWMMDTYSMHVGYSCPGVVTGKPLELGGSLGRTEATGRGAFFTLDELQKIHKFKPSETTIAAQGFGNVSLYFTLLSSEAGYKVVAVSDSSCGIYNANGLDIKKVQEYKLKNKSLKGFPGAEEITNAQLLELDVDVLAPSALEGAINSSNVKNIKAKYIIEGANGPVTTDADKVLFNKDVTIVPDILANSGGVTVSYFEWVQDLANYFWTEDDVNQKLHMIIQKSFKDVWAISKEKKIDMRTAAFVLALQRLQKAIKLRGVYP